MLDKSRRREELLDAAARAIRRLGATAKMDDLAAEAGITKPVLYTHFGDKAGLAAALAERSSADIRAGLLTALTTPEDYRLMVRGCVDAFIGFVEREPEIYKFVLHGGLSSAAGVPQRRMFDELGVQIGAVIAMARRQAGVDTAPAEAWSFALLGAVLSVAEWWTEHPSTPKGELVDHVTDLFWGGLQSR